MCSTKPICTRNGKSAYLREDGANRSCSVLVARRRRTTRSSSVTAAETWLAAASSKLTGERPKLVACVLEAATRFDSVASTHSSKTCTPSGSEYRREWDRTSSRILVTGLTTHFIGMSMRVGALPRPAERRVHTKITVPGVQDLLSSLGYCQGTLRETHRVSA